MARKRALLVVMAAIGTSSVLGDVPLGECHNCEVHCFEDCTQRFHHEVIQGDRREYELKQRMLRENGGGSLSARGLAGVSFVEETKQQVAQFEQCLAEEKCPTHDVLNAPAKGCHTSSLLATEGKKCATEDQSCAQKCAGKASSMPAFMQKKSLRKNFPHAPVDRGAFEKGEMTLDFCFKGCLAVVCGCKGAPGFSKIEKLFRQIKKNDNAGEPVIDTPAQWQYREPTQAECGKGIKKVKGGLYANIHGGVDAWNEICTKEFFTDFYGPAWNKDYMAEALKKCKSSATDPETQKFGCNWEDNGCVFTGTTPKLSCSIRHKTDPTL